MKTPTNWLLGGEILTLIGIAMTLVLHLNSDYHLNEQLNKTETEIIRAVIRQFDATELTPLTTDISVPDSADRIAGIDFGDDSSVWNNDGECDDPRFVGPGMGLTSVDEYIQRDATDCRELSEAGRVSLGPMAEVTRDTLGTPAQGSVTLSSGFVPDPHTVEVEAGGQLDAADFGPDCTGLISNSPDYEVRFETDALIPLYISVESEADTTLIINTPKGDWICDDDSGLGLDPSIEFTSPVSGNYDIWVGAYGEEDDSQPATLSISEIAP